MSSNRRKFKSNDKQNGSNNRGRRRNPKLDERKPKEIGGELDSRDKDNDPNDYFDNLELAKQASELSFQYMIGGGPIVGNFEIPGIMTIEMNPCPGITYPLNSKSSAPGTIGTNIPNIDANDLRDGINLMSTKLYTLLSEFSGRTSVYAPQDVAVMILAIGEVASLSEYIRRVFGVAMTYNARNRLLPIRLIEAMGVNASDLFANIANYRMRFNISMTRINQIPLLDNISYIKKCRRLYQKIYMDTISNMAQLYLYVPHSTWTLEEQTNPQGTYLQDWPVLTQYPTTLADYLDLLEMQIRKLLESSTLNIIYSDLLNLATKTNVPMWKFDYLAEDYAVVPEYNANALLQIHNLDIIGAPLGENTSRTTAPTNNPFTVASTYGGWDITPGNKVYPNVNNNAVVYNPVFPNVVEGGNWQTGFSSIGPAPYQGTVVDMPTDAPTIEDRIESLRFSITRSGYVNAFGSSTAPNWIKSKIVDLFPALPDHYCVMVRVFASLTESDISTNYFGVNAGGLMDSANYLVATSQFQYHPMNYVYGYTVDSNQQRTSTNVESMNAELNFSTVVDYDYMVRLNRLMYTGLFNFRV